MFQWRILPPCFLSRGIDKAACRPSAHLFQKGCKNSHSKKVERMLLQFCPRNGLTEVGPCARKSCRKARSEFPAWVKHTRLKEFSGSTLDGFQVGLIVFFEAVCHRW